MQPWHDVFDLESAEHVRGERRAVPSREKGRFASVARSSPLTLDPAALKEACLRAGADDVGFVCIDRPEIRADREDILEAFPRARSLVAFVIRMNPVAIRSPMRSIANREFHAGTDETNDVARRIIAHLESVGAQALSPSAGFPMEMDRFPGKIWVVSHKKVAEAAGLGAMGIHRNLIHPRFGNFILLGTVITDARIDEVARPLDFNPCLECKLCVAACPVGAIGKDGGFQFDACYTHNYREFMGGFTDWATTLAESADGDDYRRRVSDAESSSMWQSLSFGANYKAAYCMAVCPAGEDVIGPYLASKRGHLQEVVKPLQAKVEDVYVVPGTDAEAVARRRFPHKRLRKVKSSLRPTSIESFLRSLRLVFQPGRGEDLDARFHFQFTGDEERDVTIAVRHGSLSIEEGLVGEADVKVRADGRAWLEYSNGERGIAWALLTRKIRLSGSRSLLRAFGQCFPR